LLIVVALTLLLAFANGANDVSKGIATLVGSGVSSYRSAVAWGALCTVLGALFSSLLARGLVETFSGKGILVHSAMAPAFLIAVAIGAIGWLVIATCTGLPVSTTHSLVGALLGVALVAHGAGGVVWSAILSKVVVPLAVSPLMALVLLLFVSPLTRRLDPYCVCVEQGAAVTPEGIELRSMAEVVVARQKECGKAVARTNSIDVLHWISAGATSFFRGMNDAPKIVALAIAAGGSMFSFVALAMGAGSLLAGLRVTKTLAEKVTRISPANGFSANVVTSLLVGVASRFGLPVSTTHVSSGAIIGVGLSNGGVRWKTIGEMALAWAVTLPVSGMIGAAAYFVVG